MSRTILIAVWFVLVLVFSPVVTNWLTTYPAGATRFSTNFAWPNYLLFMGVSMMLASFAVLLFRRKPYVQAGALALVAWVTRENWRWDAMVLQSHGNPFLETI